MQTLLPDASALPLILRQWQYSSETAVDTMVLPDGCRDLIVRISTDGQPDIFVSALADGAASVACQAGERFAGYRFHPAAHIDESALVALAVRHMDDHDGLLMAVAEHTRLDTRLAEALDALSSSTTISTACRRIGVSERSLERLLRESSKRPPGYWRGLARVRRAAAALDQPGSLAEVAASHGYADQAHLTRAFRHWFGTTPGAFRRQPALLALAAEPGYC
ncbi:helix-turn-helix domain-containing protein [Azoarcus communis]|uniref:helix-turn-helix domain-containing protein n=1 Tax=Parazoarcus communis TaxID=41977 RepID=UPI0014592962|nr:helix-turn-helix domain-containing protein [Parazoarcus communis]NMG50049.1 helix-turn-helix domain-containing protein [Parazoarcus communis]